MNDTCNLRCKYCYEYNKKNICNNIESIKAYLDVSIYEACTVNTKDITIFEIIGGEVFLHTDMLTEIVEYIFKKHIEYNIEAAPIISISTNGTILNDSVREFFYKYGRYLQLGISIDGTKECHDLNRIDIHGNGSYDKIVENLEFFKKHVCNRNLNAKATFNHDTIKYYKDSIMNLINLGFTNIIANTVYEETWTEEDQDMIFFQLRDVADYLLDNNLENKIRIYQINPNYTDYNKSSLGHIRDTNHCGSCKYMHCLGMNNKIYGCHRFSSNYLHPIGTLKNKEIDITDSKFIEEVSNQYLYYPEECNTCDFVTICGTCASLPYELNITAKDWFAQKRQCGFTKAVGYAQVYFIIKLKEKQKCTK